MTGADFAEWRTALGLSLTEAAKLLRVGRRAMMGYLKKDELPPVVAIACRALARDRHVLAAHYVPTRKSTRLMKRALGDRFWNSRPRFGSRESGRLRPRWSPPSLIREHVGRLDPTYVRGAS
jgi:hypothetical protein